MKMFMVGGAALLGGLLFVGMESVEARPPFIKVFSEEYPDVKEAATAKCAVCHVGKATDKKWNNYGEAIGKALGKPKASPDELKAAFGKVAGEKSAVEGKTFGELIKEGKLPSTK